MLLGFRRKQCPASRHLAPSGTMISRSDGHGIVALVGQNPCRDPLTLGLSGYADFETPVIFICIVPSCVIEPGERARKFRRALCVPSPEQQT